MAGVHEVNALKSLAAQVSIMTSMIKDISVNGCNTNITCQQPCQFKNIECVYYGDEHAFKDCPSNSESIYYVGNQHQNGNGLGPQSNHYNPKKSSQFLIE